jgi:hypothetical protein
MFQVRRIIPKSAAGFICETCGRVAEIDAAEMEECIKHKHAGCVWIPKDGRKP